LFSVFKLLKNYETIKKTKNCKELLVQSYME